MNIERSVKNSIISKITPLTVSVTWRDTPHNSNANNHMLTCFPGVTWIRTIISFYPWGQLLLGKGIRLAICYMHWTLYLHQIIGFYRRNQEECINLMLISTLGQPWNDQPTTYICKDNFLSTHKMKYLTVFVQRLTWQMFMLYVENLVFDIKLCAIPGLYRNMNGSWLVCWQGK